MTHCRLSSLKGKDDEVPVRRFGTEQKAQSNAHSCSVAQVSPHEYLLSLNILRCPPASHQQGPGRPSPPGSLFRGFFPLLPPSHPLSPSSILPPSILPSFPFFLISTYFSGRPACHFSAVTLSAPIMGSGPGREPPDGAHMRCPHGCETCGCFLATVAEFNPC